MRKSLQAMTGEELLLVRILGGQDAIGAIERELRRRASPEPEEFDAGAAPRGYRAAGSRPGMVA